MERDITELFSKGSFDQLSRDEKRQLEELCASEEEFQAMKDLFTGMENNMEEPVQPSDSVKRSLDQLFEETYPSRKRVIWYNSVLTTLYPVEKPAYRRPLLQVAAAVLVVLLMVPFLGDFKSDQPVQVASVKKEDVEKFIQEKTEKTDKTNVVTTPIAPVQQEAETSVQSPEVVRVSSRDPLVLEESMSLDETETIMTAVADAGMAAPAAVFDHPDGIFQGTVAEVSQPVRRQIKVLDLLTPTF